ncbi:putative membrane copper tolerance protein [Hyphomicrobium sulfonivorans]|uniref:Putative membrane copper tolerance protein n=1 Tax=Hyphomicrobium sulfonivorans TaxID=121290 RepID=A0A125NU19_HYPSL|nr:sulfite exporter TauE/SafE family protein [Hyphomicrobium sulfonivorans]KWT65248.1 putative membrane copper tolerance protein [Hyphomicrobium sulfonivorans]
MDAALLIILNGLALGLASTLHCAGMCGAISCSLMLAQERAGGADPRFVFALNHAGRICSYSIAGAIVGLVGAPAISWLDRDAAFHLLQWAAASSLIWIGLSTAGLVPSITIIDRGLTSLSDSVARWQSRGSGQTFVPLASGLAWGMMPCAMVYAALFTAMLTGSFSGGALTMAAFGIGTLPGLLASTFGFRQLAQIKRNRGTRIAAGLAVAVFGAATVLLAHPQSPYFCFPGTTTSTHSAAPSSPKV